MPEEFDDFKDRIRAERSVRAQRDAAERGVPGERLRREIREAFDDDEPGDPTGGAAEPTAGEAAEPPTAAPGDSAEGRA